jgi:hypothetical protein
MTKHEHSISVSRDIDAAAQQIFDHLARPADHPHIDGSGMLRGTDYRHALSGIGDVFEMKMFNDQMGEYAMENHVVEFERDRRIAWEPVLKAADNPEFQSRVVAPQPVGGTRVTAFYDLSAAPEWVREATNDGENWRPGMEASLANLAKLVEQA